MKGEIMKKILNYLKENRKEILLVLSMILFVFITYAIFNDKISYIDSLAHSYILSIRNDTLTSILLIITNLSGPIALIILTIILLIIIKDKKIPILIMLNLIFTFLLNQILKSIFIRPRPIGINLIEESGFSYPSGHAMISMAYYGFIAYLIYKKISNKIIKTISIISLLLIIVLVGFSRIYLGVHYLSDIIGGFLLSIGYLIIYIKCINLEKK